jgi:hypothetical protein
MSRQAISAATVKIPQPTLSLQNLWDELDLEAAENSAGTWQTFDLENRMKNSQAINDVEWRISTFFF